MENSRSILQLLRLLLYSRVYLGYGLCWTIRNLVLGRQITGDERETLHFYINTYGPSYRYGIYRWPYGDGESRIKWLEQQIQKLEQDEEYN